MKILKQTFIRLRVWAQSLFALLQEMTGGAYIRTHESCVWQSPQLWHLPLWALSCFETHSALHCPAHVIWNWCVCIYSAGTLSPYSSVWYQNVKSVRGWGWKWALLTYEGTMNGDKECKWVKEENGKPYEETKRKGWREAKEDDV